MHKHIHNAKSNPTTSKQATPDPISKGNRDEIQRILKDKNISSLNAESTLYLQRLIGNRAVSQLIQAKNSEGASSIVSPSTTRIQRSNRKAQDAVKVLWQTDVKDAVITRVVTDDGNESKVMYEVQFTDTTVKTVPGFLIFPSYKEADDIIPEVLKFRGLKEYDQNAISQHLGLDQPSEEGKPFTATEDNVVGGALVPINQRPIVTIKMNEGLVDNLNRVIIYNTDPLLSCSLIIMFNPATNVGALYHFPASQLKQERQKIEQIFRIANPQVVKLIHSSHDTSDFLELELFFRQNLGVAPEQSANMGASSITLSDQNQLEVRDGAPETTGGKQTIQDYTGGIARFY